MERKTRSKRPTTKPAGNQLAQKPKEKYRLLFRVWRAGTRHCVNSIVDSPEEAHRIFRGFRDGSVRRTTRFSKVQLEFGLYAIVRVEAGTLQDTDFDFYDYGQACVNVSVKDLIVRRATEWLYDPRPSDVSRVRRALQLSLMQDPDNGSYPVLLEVLDFIFA